MADYEISGGVGNAEGKHFSFREQPLRSGGILDCAKITVRTNNETLAGSPTHASEFADGER